jgi:hypothetical protein
LVDAPSGVEKAQLFLSNNNQVWIDPDRYFKIKPVSELQQSTNPLPEKKDYRAEQKVTSPN